MSTHSPLPDAFVVGTAGHIDHGKTSLVRALTGVNLDSLPEERRRGITIALGFTTLPLPSGRVASFVDVPGHERLVRTMVAGASGIDAVMLCVSASEGVMPQTREHLDILRILGVKHGVIALTMADLVDEEMAELAAEDARDAVAGTFLEDAPLLVTSAHKGTGLPELVAALDALPALSRDASGPFRLPVDRCFVRKGFGSVVTGTVLSGQVEDGQELALLPQLERTRVRGLQVHGLATTRSRAGFRTALNLAGVERDALPRGTVVASPDQVPVTSILDVSYQHLADAPRLESGARARLLLGTAEVMVVVDGLDGDLEPGQPGLLQLRTAAPLACMPGDRFVLRRESPVTTLGGGQVLDPWARRWRKRHFEQAAEQLSRLEDGEKLVLLERAGVQGLTPTQAQARLGPQADQAVLLGDRMLTRSMVQQLEQQLVHALDEWHAEHPLASALGRRELVRGPLTPLKGAAFDALVLRLERAGVVVIDGPRLRRATWQVQLTAPQQAELDLLEQRLQQAGLSAVDSKTLFEGLEHGEALVTLLVEGRRALRVGGRYTSQPALDTLVTQVQQVLRDEGALSPGRFKELTGLTRKNAIPLLEWLDAEKITRRQGDVRVAR